MVKRKNYSILMKYLSVILIILVSCNDSDTPIKTIEHKDKDSIQEKLNKMDDDESISPDYTFSTVHSEDIGWGYQILIDGETFIIQPHIPSVQGNKGFKTEAQAKKTAEFMIHKLNNNVFPPTVSPQELDSLGVLD